MRQNAARLIAHTISQNHKKINKKGALTHPFGPPVKNQKRPRWDVLRF